MSAPDDDGVARVTDADADIDFSTPTVLNGNGNGHVVALRPNLSLRGLETYDVRRVAWLDKPFLQRSAFHVLAGRKGSCKGTWICGLAARVSRGDLYDTPKRVLVITSEDSVELDFKPRLLASAGDPSMVTIVNGPFRMPIDLEWLEQQARELGNVGLIVIDPIGNHTAGIDTDKEGLVREAIGPLNPMADALDCMIVGVRHLGKDVSRGALASVLGSTAWVDVPRCVILMARDDEDELLFHYQVVAGNRGPRNSGRAFRLELIDVPPAEEITLAVAAGDSTKDVEALLGAKVEKTAPASRSAQASELILDILEGEGEQESDQLDARIATETGLAAQTVRNLRTKLGKAGLIRAQPEKDEHGTVTRWIVRRTQAPRDTEPDTAPATTPLQIPLNQATSRPDPLESVCEVSGYPDTDATERGSGRDQAEPPPLDDDDLEALATTEAAREAQA